MIADWKKPALDITFWIHSFGLMMFNSYHGDRFFRLQTANILLPLYSFAWFSASTFLKQALEGEYPKLLRLYNDLWKRLHQFSLSVETGSLSVATDAMVAEQPIESMEEDIFRQSDSQETKYE